MTRVLLTFAQGDNYGKLSRITFPRMVEYAKRHDLWYNDSTPEMVNRPASWMKIPKILKWLKKDFEVLWLDADIYIKDFRCNIFEELHKDSWHGLVLHSIGHWNSSSYVPNCGVWVLRKEMIPILESMWDNTKYIHHCNWEQAALISLMGGDPDNIAKSPMPHWPVSKEIEFKTTWLDYSWNNHPMDVRRFNPDAYFWHCTGFGDRLQTLEAWDGKS